MLINDILASGPGDEYVEAKVTVLSEEITHHVKEEEKQHDNMFQQARAAEVDLDALGEQLLARKEELKRQAEKAGLPPAAPVTMSTRTPIPTARPAPQRPAASATSIYASQSTQQRTIQRIRAA